VLKGRIDKLDAKTENTASKAEATERRIGTVEQKTDQVKQASEEIQAVANKSLQASLVAIDTAQYSSSVIKAPVVNESKAAAVEIKPGLVPDDPWKGAFGAAQANGRSLEAQVTVFSNTYCAVKIQVKSTDPHNPLSGHVKFFLHPTFGEVHPLVPVVQGVAELNLLAYGAFTIGALADDGNTRLEYDLMDSDAPEWFKKA
jgi:hypothetical protein